MFEPSDQPRLFALPPGADFPRELARGLIERSGNSPPEAMARVTLFLNTGRMLRAVRAAFDGQGARFLPRLRLVSDLAHDPVPGLPMPIPPLGRRLDLARLVAALVRGRAEFASGAATIDLADSLARLLDEMQGEGVSPDVFEAPDFAENHARHWEESLRFIRIMTRYLGSDSHLDPEGRRRKVVERLVAEWQSAPPRDPVIVAGSTGSRGTTFAFMRAVAVLPQGAVILPGYDFDTPESGWNSLDFGAFPAEDHPQYRFRALLASLGLRSADVLQWRPGTAPDPRRNLVLSMALRPAPVTDLWLSEGPLLGDLPAAMAGVTVIEAATPREEATAAAIRLRKAAEDGIRAALITPDRILARRVATALDCWGIVPDDSAGRPLSQSAAGRFLRQTAALGLGPVSSEVLLALLKHPITATGADDRGPHLRFTRELELAFRRKGVVFPDRRHISGWAEGSKDPHRLQWATWVTDIAEWVQPVGEQRLSDSIETHLQLAETIAGGPGGKSADSKLWREAAGELARRAMQELASAAADAPDFSATDYADLVASVLSSETLRQTESGHPLIAIWGTLEARVQGAGLVILAGLNEGVWPGNPEPDPWLSRQMRRKAGLLSPERQIGLSAHDFQQAAGAAEVVLSRATRDDEAETVSSRWLSRLQSLLRGLPDQGGRTAWEGMKERGDEWLRLARVAEAPRAAHRAKRAHRPAPRPPAAARPTRLPVTAIRTLIRDPYAIYADRVLRLRPLDPLVHRPDARLRGTVTHAIMDAFIRERPGDESAEAARHRLRAVAERVIDDLVPRPETRRMYLAKLDRIAPDFIADELLRVSRGHVAILEESGSVSLEHSAFVLTARPDRIDRLNDGRVLVYDYKTGAIPTFRQQDHFDKQLRLEAAMAERGGFEKLGLVTVADAAHIGLGSSPGEKSANLTPDILAETWIGLETLVKSYARQGTGYSSRRAVLGVNTQGDHDHLARFGEWEMSDLPNPEDVG